MESIKKLSRDNKETSTLATSVPAFSNKETAKHDLFNTRFFHQTGQPGFMPGGPAPAPAPAPQVGQQNGASLQSTGPLRNGLFQCGPAPAGVSQNMLPQTGSQFHSDPINRESVTAAGAASNSAVTDSGQQQRLEQKMHPTAGHCKMEKHEVVENSNGVASSAGAITVDVDESDDVMQPPKPQPPSPEYDDLEGHNIHTDNRHLFKVCSCYLVILYKS